MKTYSIIKRTYSKVKDERPTETTIKRFFFRFFAFRALKGIFTRLKRDNANTALICDNGLWQICVENDKAIYYYSLYQK